MNVLKTAVQEVIGLFIEDGRYAAAIFAWILIAGVGLPRLPIPESWGPEMCKAVLLFMGLATLLVDNVVRSARKR